MVYENIFQRFKGLDLNNRGLRDKQLNSSRPDPRAHHTKTSVTMKNLKMRKH